MDDTNTPDKNAAAAAALAAALAPAEEAPKTASAIKDIRELTNPQWPHYIEVTKTKGKGKEAVEYTVIVPKPVAANVEYLLNEYGIVVRYNEMKRETEVHIPFADFSEDNADERALGVIVDLVALNGIRGMSKDAVDEAIQRVGELHRYHPVREWVSSKPWDGVSRLQEFIETLEVEAKYIKHRNSVVKRWLLSAIAAAFRTSREIITKFEGALVLQGAQNAGKTTWYAALAPAKLEAVKSSFKLVPGNKDSVFTLNGHWIVELGELDSTFSASEMGSLKAFMSDSKDVLRKAYGRKYSKLTRQTVVGASVNKHDYLVDDTGNRRWWTIPVVGIKRHTIDMQQLWAEVKAMFDADEQWWLTDAEQEELAKVNRDFGAVIPVRELILGAFKFPSALQVVGSAAPVQTGTRIRMTATEVVQLFGLRLDDRKTVGEAGRALRELQGEPQKSNGQLVWRLALRPDSPLFASLEERAEKQKMYGKR